MGYFRMDLSLIQASVHVCVSQSARFSSVKTICEDAGYSLNRSPLMISPELPAFLHPKLV